MTTHRDFKRLVRARALQTGETYTAARAALLAERERADPAPANSTQRETPGERSYYATTVARFFDGPRLRSIPARRRPRVVVLLELLQRFEPGRVYTEREVSLALREAHEDFASLRRELVDYGYLTRADGLYRRAATLPARDRLEAQEVPQDEARWFAPR